MERERRAVAAPRSDRVNLLRYCFLSIPSRSICIQQPWWCVTPAPPSLTRSITYFSLFFLNAQLGDVEEILQVYDGREAKLCKQLYMRWGAAVDVCFSARNQVLLCACGWLSAGYAVYSSRSTCRLVKKICWCDPRVLLFFSGLV